MNSNPLQTESSADKTQRQHERKDFLKPSLGILLGSAQESASTITVTCDSGLQNDGTCAVLNSTIAALYGTTFTNANGSAYIPMAGPRFLSSIPSAHPGYLNAGTRYTGAA